MRRIACCTIPRWAATLAGSAAVALAMTASSFGVDHNTEWGPRRKVLLVLGLIVLLLAQRRTVGRSLRSVWHAIGRTPMGRGLAKTSVQFAAAMGHPGRRLERIALRLGTGRAGEDQDRAPGQVRLDRSQTLFLVGLILATELVYVWFVSVGFWRHWPESTAYYDMMADAFVRGQTALLVEPDPRLLELEDPYSLAAREGIYVLWDASFYRGKYYAYWGPAPAVLVAIPNLVLDVRIADQYIVFLATSAVLCLSTLILVFFWNRYFAGRLGFWLLPAGVLLVGLALPSLWVLSYPTIHEAAVSSGMAFFLGGVYAALPILDQGEVRRHRLVLAGALWALALASRLVLLVPTLLLVVVLIIRLARQGGKHGLLTTGINLTSLLLPMAVGAVLLGWYNFDRFGNLLETGFRFQLSWRHETWDRVFDVRYMIPNLYNYLFGGFRPLPVFPFIKPIPGVEAVPFLPGSLHPARYTAENVSGLLVSTPAHWFALFLAWLLICSQPRSSVSPGAEPSTAWRGLPSSLSVILAAAILAFLPVGIYYWAANRFQMDFSPLVAILSVTGTWVAVDWHRKRSARRMAVQTLVAVMILASVTISFLLAVSGDQLRFEKLNPDLFDWITRGLAW